MVSSLSAIDEEYDWDVVTYHYLRRGRECIIPEVGMEFCGYKRFWAAVFKQYVGTVFPDFFIP